MIKVLNIITDSNIGGAGRCLLNYVRYCDKTQFDTAVVLPTGSDLKPDLLALGARLIELDGIAEKSFSPKAIRAMERIIREEKPDIVHTHGSFSGRIAGKRCKTRVVFTRHSGFTPPGYLKKGPLHGLHGALQCRYADRVIAISPFTAQNLMDGGIPERRIAVMMNGVAPLTPASPEAQAALRRRWSIPEGIFTAGILARLEPYKGQMLLLDAAKILREQGREFCILIGGAGSQEQGLRARIGELGLSEQVKMVGFVQDVAEFLSVLDVQVNSSYVETSSLSVIEGMTLSVPAVASNCQGNPWLVDDGISGLLFESGNARDLAEKIAQMMDDPEKRAALGRGARQAYETRFTGEIYAKNVEDVYRDMMDTKVR